MRFTIDDKHFIKWMWVKKIRRKMLARQFWQKMKSWWGVKHVLKYQCEIFKLCWSLQEDEWNNFFGMRIVNLWNSLSDTVATAPSVNCFKGRFDRQNAGNRFSMEWVNGEDRGETIKSYLWRSSTGKLPTRLMMMMMMMMMSITTTRTRFSDATAVTFSVKCFNPLKLYSMSENIFRKWFASYFLFIHEHVITMWSPTLNLIAATAVLLTPGLHRC